MRRWHGNPWAILITLCLGFFMTLLDLTIVNIAIPSMIDELGASLDEILWVVNAYIIVLAVLLITAGRLGDIRGPRAMLIAGVALFTVSSVACGLAPEPWLLIAFRAIQGLGAALLMPQTLTLLTLTFPPEKRGMAFGIWGAVAGVATIAGPTLGGLLVTALDWRWIFFINVPVGVLVLVMAVTLVPDVAPRASHALDIPGVVLASIALVLLTFGLVEGERFGWGQVWSFVSIPLLLALGAAVMAVFFVLQARRQHREPLLPFVLFRDRNYAVMNAVGAIVSIAMVGMFLPLTIYLQSVLGFSALKAGLTLAPMSVVSMFVAPVAGRLSDRIGGKYILMTGLSLFAVGMAALVWAADVDSTWATFLVPLLVAGLGVGCVFAPMQTIAMRNVVPQVAGAASGVINTVRQLGSVLGSAVVGAVLQAHLASSLRAEATVVAADLPESARQPFVDGFADASHGGLEVGAGQSGVEIPTAELPADVAHAVADAAHRVFTYGYVDAMRPTLAIPIGVVVVGAALCALIRRRRPSPAATASSEAAVPAG